MNEPTNTPTPQSRPEDPDSGDRRWQRTKRATSAQQQRRRLARRSLSRRAR